ncbi:unnamed protein product [Periconia digitata]|uniref:Zn(2)-C6 fungal-type domain-containing protein n=1 Tax=Periconia digitata TaxID=1303443 RepID=A0A9W4U872_9PLEO|nr:unnamed protein product [Periconia digitata]
MPEISTRSHGTESPIKKKLRKGTRSCWECKRRKARCSLSQTQNVSVCDGCKRRGTRCISQQHPDDQTNTKKHLGDRLGYVEDILYHLKGGIEKPHANDSDQLRGMRIDKRANIGRLHVRPEEIIAQHHRSTGQPRHHKLTGISQALLSAWPTPDDLEAIVSAPMGTASVYRGLICTSYEVFMENPLPSPRELLVTPESSLNPVFVARKLLMLATYLQNLSPAAVTLVSEQLTVNFRGLMDRAFNAATELVTNNDELTGSVEGIECIMMAALYLNNAGRLRLAYLAIRRALTIAQMIGLDRGSNSSLIRILDQDTLERISPEFMWFRLVQTDRYLSLQQGLPQGYIGDSFFVGNQAENLHSPAERFEQVVTIAAGRIIQRNGAAMLDLKATREIDAMLLSSANSMPSQWWLYPDLTTDFQDERDLLRETGRFIMQIAYYQLLERLHLPFLLQQSTSSEYDYSKMTAVTASREVLSRFIVFRSSSPPKGTFCRGIDFVAFSASVVTCLGHINARLRHSNQGARQGNTVFDCFAHQRLADRAMMERTLTCLEKALQDDPSDGIAHKICRGMRYLLAVEADVASGIAYRTESVYRNEDSRNELECDDQLSGARSRAIRIHIPHLGTIKVEPHGTTGALFQSSNPASIGSALQDFESAPTLETYSSPDIAIAEYTEGQNGTNSWPVEDLGSLCFGLDEFQDNQWSMSGNEWGDTWSLQGMNSAFFDSLFTGSDSL